ncbi:MAG: CinA family protein [Candidatus Omnitrophota bacterium]
MEPIVKHTYSSLIKMHKTVAVAESCTGGLLSNLLTYIGGSSKYFILGIVAYSNKSKQDILKIPAGLIAKKGTVSQEVAEKMAQNVRKMAKADFGIGVTGIAGPTGGTPQKPAGTVFIAVTSENKTISKKFYFTCNRTVIRKKTALKALGLLDELIK